MGANQHLNSASARPAGLPGDAVVFVVDSDRAVARGLESLLKTYHLDVSTFSTAEALLERMDAEALAITESSKDPARPSCLITEMGLPGMSGLGLLEQLRARGRHLPVILMANRSDVQAAVRAMRAGAIDVLEKPFSQDLLLNRLSEALNVNIL